MVQRALLALMDLVHKNEISITDVVRKTSHDVATCFNIENRGFLRPGYFADLVLINRDRIIQQTKQHSYKWLVTI